MKEQNISPAKPAAGLEIARRDCKLIASDRKKFARTFQTGPQKRPRRSILNSHGGSPVERQLPTTNSDDSNHRKVFAAIAQVERDQRCVKRVASLMATLTALAVVALGYGEILQPNFGYGSSGLIARLICGFGLGTLISFVVTAGLSLAYRRNLNDLMRECYQLAVKLAQGRELPSSSDGVMEKIPSKQ